MNDLDLADGLHDLLDRTVADLPVPTDRLRAGAVRSGRSVRRRRRIAAAAGTLAAAAVVGALVVPAVGGDGVDDAGIATDPGRHTSTTYDRPAGWWDMPGRTMRDRLAALLPEGVTILSADFGNGDRAPGEKPHGGWLQVDLADAHGNPAGGVNIVLYPPFEDGGAFVRERITCPGNLDDSDWDLSCDGTLDEQGEPIGRTARSVAEDVVVLDAEHLDPSGGLITVGSSNSSDSKWGLDSAIDRPEPLLSATQLRAIAMSPTWERWTPPAD